MLYIKVLCEHSRIPSKLPEILQPKNWPDNLFLKFLMEFACFHLIMAIRVEKHLSKSQPGSKMI